MAGDAAPKGSRWEWLTEFRVFRKVADGATLAVEKVRAAVDSVVAKGERLAKKLADSLVRGRLTVPEWQGEMEALIKASHAATGLIGGGGVSAISGAEKARIESKIKHQFDFVEKFAKAVEDGLTLGGNIAQRAAQYVTAAIATFEGSRRVGDLAWGYEWERRILNAVVSCPQCQEYADMGWQSALTLPDIGEECECQSRCRCSWVRAKSDPR